MEREEVRLSVVSSVGPQCRLSQHNDKTIITNIELWLGDVEKYSFESPVSMDWNRH